MGNRKLANQIMKKIMRYGDKHDLESVCGSEYIMQSDGAQEDALELVCDIFDLFSGVK